MVPPAWSTPASGAPPGSGHKPTCCFCSSQFLPRMQTRLHVKAAAITDHIYKSQRQKIKGNESGWKGAGSAPAGGKGEGVKAGGWKQREERWQEEMVCSGEPRCAPTDPDPTHSRLARLFCVLSLGILLGAGGFLAVQGRHALHPPVTQGTGSWKPLLTASAKRPASPSAPLRAINSLLMGSYYLFNSKRCSRL